jgi:hypothetical protein
MFGRDETHSELEDARKRAHRGLLDDTLSADDRQRFESLFRSSSLLNERVELASGPARGSRIAGSTRGSWLPWAAACPAGLVGGGVALQAKP